MVVLSGYSVSALRGVDGCPLVEGYRECTSLEVAKTPCGRLLQYERQTDTYEKTNRDNHDIVVVRLRTCGNQ
jgi:hypothetical protein